MMSRTNSPCDRQAFPSAGSRCSVWTCPFADCRRLWVDLKLRHRSLTCSCAIRTEYSPSCIFPVSGAALWYSDVLIGAPPTLERHLTKFPALHAVNVVLTVRYVPVPEVFDEERFLIKALPIPGFYHVVARCVSLPMEVRRWYTKMDSVETRSLSRHCLQVWLR